MSENWSSVLRIVAKAAIFFILLNLAFAVFYPLDLLGSISLYNWILTGRERLPYGENPEDSYNLSLNNLPAMAASHTLSQDKGEDEFRVVIVGDSGAWGWLLENEHTLASQINQAGLLTNDGRQVVAYNFAYPIMSITKDIILLEAALKMDPDLIIWPVTLQSFDRDSQLDHPLLQENSDRVLSLIEQFGLELDPDDERFEDPDLMDRTIVGQRRELADLMRLQIYGFSWSATGIDQAFPEEITLRTTDFEVDISWLDIPEPIPLTSNELSWDVLAAGVTMTGSVPVLIVNEPIFISDGTNSDLRYNAWYPRWAYDSYRKQLTEFAENGEWHYLDLWDRIDPDNFTDSPVHLDSAGSALFGSLLVEYIEELVGQ
jgi:lysophospholipase L1-like esterase